MKKDQWEGFSGMVKDKTKRCFRNFLPEKNKE